jgi:Uma2 family endonuclease
MSVLILDPILAHEFRENRKTRQLDRWDEVWDGVLVVPAVPNNEHQRLVQRLSIPFSAIVDWDGGEQVQPGANVSDREKGWTKNYRIPDVLVFLIGNSAKDCGTHWCGGPDLAVEIVSPGDKPKQKLTFYAKVKTRELLIVDRDPWSLELYQLKSGKMRFVGHCDEANPAVLASAVLPLTFQLQPATPRPKILVAHTPTGQTWTA